MSGKLFHTTGAHALKARLAMTVLVDSCTLNSVRDADRNDILVTMMRDKISSVE